MLMITRENIYRTMQKLFALENHSVKKILTIYQTPLLFNAFEPKNKYLFK